MTNIATKYDSPTNKSTVFVDGKRLTTFSGSVLKKDETGNYGPITVFVGEDGNPVENYDKVAELSDDNINTINSQLQQKLSYSQEIQLRTGSTFSSQSTSSLSGSNIASLVKNGSNVYGSEIKNLIWPEDLLSNDGTSLYNGNYTVFFISEHQDASISQVSKNKAGFNLNSREGSVAESWKTSSGFSKQMTNAAMLGLFTYLYGKIGRTAAGKLDDYLDGKLTNVVNKVGGAQTGEFIKTAGTYLLAGGAALSSDVIQTKTQYTTLNVCIALPTPSITQTSEITWSEANAASPIFSSLHHWLSRSSGNASNSNDGSPSAFSNEGQGVLGTSSEAIAAATLASSEFAQGGFLSRMMGKTHNPRKEQIFEDVQFRSYEFKYDMFARSQKEMNNIESIIKVFKYHAHPELTPSTFMYIYPAQFDIVHYFNDKPNPHMPRHATSVLRNVSVEYGADGVMSVHNDGSPTKITLTLQFDEIAILNKKDILNGY